MSDLDQKIQKSARENSQKLEEVKERLEATEKRLEQKLDRIQSILEHFRDKEMSVNTNLY